MIKPVVCFGGDPYFYSIETAEGEVVEVASVYAFNHPKLGTGAIRTSVVIKKDDNGFETLNTVYERAIKDE
jgi:hypothetical protein